MNCGLWLRIAPLVAVAALAGGCGPEPPAPTRTMEISGELRLPADITPAGKVHVTLFHAWALTGNLRHPLEPIETFEAAPGPFTHRFSYPEGVGEGLIVYVWADVDGDGVQCTPTVRTDPSGLTEVAGFPADSARVVVNLTEACRGANWFYPPAPG
ncbi:MAG: hypothetical protein ABI661_05820 [Gammaproteobacteria bacterium]